MNRRTKKPLLRIVPAFIAAVLLWAPPLAAQNDADQNDKAIVDRCKRANAHYLKAATHLKDGKPDKARNEANACLQIYPDFADAHLLLARLGYQEGAFEAALNEIEAAQADFATFGKFYAASFQEYLKRLRDQRFQKEEYISNLSAALVGAATPAEKARLESEIGRATQELVALDEQLRNPIPPTMDVPAEYHFIHGNILFRLKRFGQAQDRYLAAVKADAHYANAYTNLIGLCLTRGDAANALKYLQQAEGHGVALSEKLKKAVLDRK